MPIATPIPWPTAPKPYEYWISTPSGSGEYIPTQEKKVAGTAGEQRPLGQGRAEIPGERARIKTILRRLEPVRRCIDHRLGRSGAQTFLAHLARLQRIVDRSDRLAAVTLHIQAGNDSDLPRASA